MIEILLSGFIGAIIGSGLIIVFTIWRDNKIERKKLAREKLEKVYGPLVALKKKIDLSDHKGGFFIPRDEKEKEIVWKIIFHYYHLIDDDLKEGLVLLHPELSELDTNKIKNIQLKVEEKIMKHYKENKRILGLR